MNVVKIYREETYYVCEGCGCIHNSEDKIFHIGGVEVCRDCAKNLKIEDPGCHFECGNCFGTCILM